MNTKNYRFVWAAFFLSVAAAQFVTKTLWRLTSFELILIALAIICICFGIWILIATQFAWRAVILVTIGIIIGQWWLIKMLTAWFLWTISGFAP